MKTSRCAFILVLVFFGAKQGLAQNPPLVVDASTASLTLTAAIDLAIKNNLSTRLAQAGSEEARGEALQAASALLPHVMGEVRESRTFKVNLEAEGFPSNSPLFPSLIGPFNTFDARFELAQTFFDLSAVRRTQAARASERTATWQEKLAAEQVATATALAYFDAERSLRAVSAAQADVTLAGSLRQLAHDQHANGIATGVDVARAETSEAQQHLKLIQTQVAAQEADIRLKRVVGLPLEQAIQLQNLPKATMIKIPSSEQAIAIAIRDRPEVQIASTTLESMNDLLKAARDQHLPTVNANADYGLSGTSPNDTARTGSIGARLDVPLFSGGQMHGQTLEAEGERHEANARLDDTRMQVEEDVRLSLQTMAAEIDETQTADQAVALASRELKMARDRYASGVGDNIQLLSAQDAMDRALDDQVNAYARYDAARVNSAAALGQAESFQ